MAGSSRTRFGLAAICAATGAIGLWNALAYPPGGGYDAVDHIAYADGLAHGWRLPHGTGEYYTPPGFYTVAALADRVAAAVGLGEPHRATQALNALLLVATTLLVWLIARRLRPGRDVFALAAAAFTGLLPVALKAAAMFHPETLDLFLSTLALWLCVKLLQQDGRSLQLAAALGLALGAAQLVRAFSLWTLAAVLVAVAVARRWRELAVVAAVAVLVPAPWYAHQRATYGGSPVFNRPVKQQPLWERRPASFYLDPGVPAVFDTPYRPHFRNRAIPTTYSELWGDYFGVWVWKGQRISSGARTELRAQSLVGLLPTLLALLGAAALLWRARRSPALLAPALLPLFGVLGYLYFTVSYPTHDGDVLKATYMLTTTSGWALGFAYALDRLRGRALAVVVAVLAALALAQLPFVLY